MKVPPAMFMKTMKRGKVRVPNVRKDTWGPQVRSLRRAGEVTILASVSKMKVHPAISMKTKADEHLSGTMEEVSEQSSARTTYCHELRAGERDPRFKMQKPRHRD